MALCDFLITQDIAGYDCEHPAVKGAESMGILINRSSINPETEIQWADDFTLTLTGDFVLKCEEKGYRVYQSGKQPFNGTQQEFVEGTNANTITNTVQLVVLKHDENFAQQLFALMNGEFVAFIPNKDGTIQIYGWETGLHCSGAVRELYSDDNLAGWQITFTEEGASKGNIFCNRNSFNNMLSEGSCPDDNS